MLDLDTRTVRPVKLVTFTNAGQLLDRCEGWLFERSDIHNTMYSSLLLVARRSPVFTGPYWFGAIEDGSGDIVACGTHNLPDGLYMAEIPGSTVGAVVDSIITAVGVPHRIMAPRHTAALLAERSSERNDVRGRFHDRWLTYRLDKAVADVEGVSGRLRKGRQDDDDLIAKWGHAYEEEEPGHIDVAEFMLLKRSEGNLYIWDDNGPRSMLTLSGPAGNGIRISSVFTSQNFRRRGYASAAVATVSEAQLSNGREFIVLSVIDGQPAERIYQRLGFRLIGSRDCYVMDK